MPALERADGVRVGREAERLDVVGVVEAERAARDAGERDLLHCVVRAVAGLARRDDEVRGQERLRAPPSAFTNSIVYEPSTSLFVTSTFWSPIVERFISACWTLQNGVGELLIVMQSPCPGASQAIGVVSWPLEAELEGAAGDVRDLDELARVAVAGVRQRGDDHVPDDVARDERRERDRVQVDVRAVAVVAAVEERVLVDRRDAEAVGAVAAVEEQRDHLRDDLVDVAERLVEADVEAGAAVQRDVDVRGRVAGEGERLADRGLEVGEADAAATSPASP